ncbi:Neurofibromin [Eumeta japonica]|uniref:Neurofibromin n=1 Tax=Eumeta variegata TaxID=151549 RepID=A0A4C1ZIN5_EUMVA|nr:Neurofibromin [Eumeta japonica]
MYHRKGDGFDTQKFFSGKNVTDGDMKQLLRILVKALESFNDLALLEALIMCLTRLQPLLRPESPIHKALFWVALSVLQLDDPTLYAAGLALMEQNLHTLDSQGAFDHKIVFNFFLYVLPLENILTRSFRSNFHFALVGHLIKGYRHPAAATVSRTCRVLVALLAIAARRNRDKFQVSADTVAYLTALVCVSEEVRSRCHVKHSLPKWLPDNCDHYCPTIDHHQSSMLIQPTASTHSSCHSRRQKSWDVLDQAAISSAHGGRSPTLQSGSGGHSPHLPSVPHQDSDSGRAHSMQHGAVGDAARAERAEDVGFEIAESSRAGAHSIVPAQVVDDDGRGSPGSLEDGTERPASTKSGDSDYPEASTKQTSTDKDSTTPESNSLLDPSVLSDFTTQALVLTVLATLVKYTTDEDEIRILYQYLAEGSVVFPKVFPVIHSLLDMKINHVLMHCHDQVILSAVQSIIQNMIASEDASQQQLHYMQSCGFGGLWRFAGPFTKNQCTAESSELFVNCLEAMVETCLPGDDVRAERDPPPDPDDNRAAHNGGGRGASRRGGRVRRRECAGRPHSRGVS